MKCRKCGYELWNLREPRCPECGEGFDVNDWEFEKGTVEFHCHECDATLAQSEPWPWPPRCRECDSMIEWSRVRVVPVVENPPVKEKWKWELEGILPLPATILVGILLFWSIIGLPLINDPAEPSIANAVLMVVGVTAIAGLGIVVAPRRQRRQAVITWSTLLVLTIIMTSVMWIVRDRAYREFLWDRAVQMSLFDFHIAMLFYKDANHALPASPFELLDGWARPESFVVPGGTHPSTVAVGDQTLQDWIAWRNPQWSLDRHVESLRQADREWVQAGDFWFSMSELHWPGGLVPPGGDRRIAIVIGPRHPRSGRRWVSLSNVLTPFVVERHEWDAWVAQQNRLRESEGLDPLPDSLLVQ